MLGILNAMDKEGVAELTNWNDFNDHIAPDTMLTMDGPHGRMQLTWEMFAKFGNTCLKDMGDQAAISYAADALHESGNLPEAFAHYRSAREPDKQEQPETKVQKENHSPKEIANGDQAVHAVAHNATIISKHALLPHEAVMQVQANNIDARLMPYSSLPVEIPPELPTKAKSVATEVYLPKTNVVAHSESEIKAVIIKEPQPDAPDTPFPAVEFTEIAAEPLPKITLEDVLQISVAPVRRSEYVLMPSAEVTIETHEPNIELPSPQEVLTVGDVLTPTDRAVRLPVEGNPITENDSEMPRPALTAYDELVCSPPTFEADPAPEPEIIGIIRSAIEQAPQGQLEIIEHLLTEISERLSTAILEAQADATIDYDVLKEEIEVMCRRLLDALDVEYSEEEIVIMSEHFLHTAILQNQDVPALFEKLGTHELKSFKKVMPLIVLQVHPVHTLLGMLALLHTPGKRQLLTT